MKPRTWSFIFLLTTLTYFTGLLLQQQDIQFYAKPLLVSSLLGYFLAATPNGSTALRFLVAGALLFSVAGDTLLLFAGNNERYFILGLIGFLVAHIFYIICFHKIRVTEKLPGAVLPVILVTIYYAVIMAVLIPYLGALKIPVLLYGAVISFMLFLAIQLYPLKERLGARLIFFGALFFVISDSALAINKFYFSFYGSSWVIMTTYVLAQWLLTRGMVQYMNRDAVEGN